MIVDDFDTERATHFNGDNSNPRVVLTCLNLVRFYPGHLSKVGAASTVISLPTAPAGYIPQRNPIDSYFFLPRPARYWTARTNQPIKQASR